MQTFLPYADVERSASVLDGKRLVKQVLEASQISKVLRTPSARGWRNHPAVLMWKGHEDRLIVYGFAMCSEYAERFGRMHALQPGFEERVSSMGAEPSMPWWMGDERFHSSHRAVLLAKDREWYSRWGWSEEPAAMTDGSWPYFWPSKMEHLRGRGDGIEAELPHG